jgi:hypothetical protein
MVFGFFKRVFASKRYKKYEKRGIVPWDINNDYCKLL